MIRQRIDILPQQECPVKSILYAIEFQDMHADTLCNITKIGAAYNNKQPINAYFCFNILVAG